MEDYNIVSHRHVHPDSTQAAFVELRKALDECADALREAMPHWIASTEYAPVTKDDYDYMLERMHDSPSGTPYLAHGLGAFPGISMTIRTGHLCQKKKECMFKKENGNAKS